MKVAVRVLLAVLFAGAARAQEERTPALEGFRLSGEQWTCVADGKPLSGLLLKPEGYDAEAERRFPVLYWLHGSGGGLPGLPELAQRFDAAMRAGKMPPALVVFPNGLPGGMWCDSKDGRTLIRQALGDAFWSFYRAAFAQAKAPSPSAR
jgi:poly(3-hydroxybutyrate) depolymerase